MVRARSVGILLSGAMLAYAASVALKSDGEWESPQVLSCAAAAATLTVGFAFSFGRFAGYTVASTLAAFGIVGYAYATRLQFYSAVIFLVTSKLSIMIIGNFVFLATLLAGKLTKSIFLGTLRDGEIDVVVDTSRYAVIETCLALTIFREELSVTSVLLFGALIFAKVFHWLAQSRLDYIERQQAVATPEHLRLIALLSTLTIVDVLFVTTTVQKTTVNGHFEPSVLILFGFEFSILGVLVTTTALRYALYAFDRCGAPAEGDDADAQDFDPHTRSIYRFYVELLGDAARVALYVVFFLIIFVHYGVPFFILHDLYAAVRALNGKFRNLWEYRRMMANMNRFPHPTPEQLAGDNTCIICREDMPAGPGSRVLPHMLQLLSGGVAVAIAASQPWLLASLVWIVAAFAPTSGLIQHGYVNVNEEEHIIFLIGI